MNSKIIFVQSPEQKAEIARGILEALPEWFGIPESREEYIAESMNRPFFCAYMGDEPAGFLSLNQTGNATTELYVMGVLKQYHRLGIGRALFDAAYKYAHDKGYSFIQVKTVQMGRYDCYDKTNLFYQSLGFKEFEVFPTLWDEHNPCQIYVMSVK